MSVLETCISNSPELWGIFQPYAHLRYFFHPYAHIRWFTFKIYAHFMNIFHLYAHLRFIQIFMYCEEHVIPKNRKIVDAKKT